MKMKDNQEEKNNHSIGRRTVDLDQDTTPRKNLIKRNLSVERDDFRCNNCHNTKGFHYDSEHSPNFNKTKCTKCEEFN